jgi:hypothetical protein
MSIIRKPCPKSKVIFCLINLKNRPLGYETEDPAVYVVILQYVGRFAE